MFADDFYRKFPTKLACIQFLEHVYWEGRPTCPYCGMMRITPIPQSGRHHCNVCNSTFSVMVNTIFHHSHVPLHKWFAAIHILLNTREKITIRKLAQKIGVTKNSAWLIQTKIQQAMIEEKQRQILLTIAISNGEQQ
jgi:transposase-like protein